MDYFDPFADPGIDLAAISTRFLLVSFDTDWRFGSAHSADLAATLEAAGVEAKHAEISSPWGHDSFLLDAPEYHRTVARFVAGGAALRAE